MRTALLYVLAFSSGFAALVYQVAWSRMLALTFGSSILAVSAVVAGFMGGMGIGAWLYHRVGDRVDHPLRSYGWLEIAIGVTTGVFTLLFVPLPHAFAAASGWIAPGPAMDLARVVSVFMLLLVPAGLMGATYPALCDVMLRDARDVERRLGWIYGLNTLGAALGALVAGFVMIEIFGSQGSVRIAHLINVGVGIVALVLARTRRSVDVDPDPTEIEHLDSSLSTWIAGLVLFGSGFATLGYEIVWFRALHYVMGSGTYVLSSALVIFLVGLGVGGTIYRPAIRSGRPVASLGAAQFLIALLALAAIGAEHWMLTTPEFSEQYGPFSLPLTLAPWWTRVAIGFGISVAIMLPATLCMGIVFPLASRLFLGSAEHLSARLGLAYLLSNLGSIAGAIVAAVWVLPALGTIGGTKLFVAVNVVLGLLILTRVRVTRTRLAAFAAAAVVCALSFGLPPRLAFENPNTSMTSGGVDRLFEEESDRGTVQVFEKRTDRSARSISIDGVMVGVTQSFSAGLYAKQTLLAHLPMALDRNIRHTLNLGVASSSTLRTLARYDWVETLDAVEINPAVIRGTRKFQDSEVLEDPRTEVHVEDAVHYLLRTPKTYDLIISDAKQDPRFAGNSKILSSELYEYALGSMSECGLFVQFLTLSYPPEYFSLILRTFRETFDEVELFVDPPHLILLVGSRCPIPGREGPTEAELFRTGVGEEIARDFFPNVAALPSLWVASGDELAESIGDGAINSWDKLPLEFLSYRMEISPHSRPIENLETLMAPRSDPNLRPPQDIAALPHFESMQSFMRIWIDWFGGNHTRARRAGYALEEANPGNRIIAKGVRRMQTSTQSR